MATPKEFWNTRNLGQLQKLLNEQLRSPINRQTVYQWKYKSEIPAERVADVAAVTGWTIQELRPDIFIQEKYR